MSSKDLDKFFDPESIAIIGATDRKDSIGNTLTENLIKNYSGDVYPVNPNRSEVKGVECLSSIKNVPQEVDLASIITPARTIPQIVHECGEKGIPAVIIISSGFRESGSEGKKLENEIKREMENYEMRILGPNSFGIIRPSSKLNVTISDKIPEWGRIAFISQSGALGPTIINRQEGTGMGLSAFVSVGNMIDVDFGDLIDYFGKDHQTDTILMHVESIDRPKKFMTSAKSFSRTGPIVLEKSGNYEEISDLVASHIGSLPEKYSLYEALFNRTGVVQVDSISDLFSCSEALAHECLPKGPNLAIITNAGGPGIMAVDSLIEYGGNLASLSDGTRSKLEEILPQYASKLNPIDISSDASVEDYVTCAEACLRDENIDGVLVIYTPQGVFSPLNLAENLADLSQNKEKTILACWLGGEKTQESQNILRKGGVPTVSAPRQGARVFMYMYRHLKNIELLYETPEILSSHKITPKDQASQRSYLKSLIENVADDNRSVLMDDESKKFLQTYGISAVETHVASNSDKAVELAKEIGFPIVLKHRTSHVNQKRKFGDVKINLRTEDEVRRAFNEIAKDKNLEYPNSKNHGVTVQRMIKNIKYKVMLGSEKYSNFGSCIVFGRGGIDGKLYQDDAVDFPPLDQIRALRLMERTNVINLIKKLDDKSSEKIKKLQEYLARLSQLIIDLPEIKRMRVTLAGWEEGLSAVDARIKLDEENIPYEGEFYDHLIIEPYPFRYIREETLKDGKKVKIRPIRPEDEPLIFDLFDNFSKETMRDRFFTHKRKIDHDDIVKFTSIDYRRTIRLIGELTENEDSKIIGMGSISIDPKGDTGEFAVAVGDPWQGIGLGTILLKSLIRIAEDKNLDSLWGVIKREGYRMIHVCEKLGFYREETNPKSLKMVLYLDS